MHPPLTFDLVSPEKLLFSKHVTMVTIPGGEGDYGVLVDHVPMVTTVKPGVIEIFPHENDAASERLFVSGGFAEVTPTRCTVLADEAIPVAELNRSVLEEQSRAITEQIAAASNDDRAALLANQAIIEAKLLVAA